MRAVPKLCAHARNGRAKPSSCCDRAGRAVAPRGPSPAGARPPSGPTCPTCPTTRACTCSATSAAGRCTWASRCRCAPARGRTSAPPPGWTERAEVVDYKPTNSELGALVLENRLIKEWRPPGNRALKRTDRWAYVRCRLDIEYPVLEVSPEPAAGHAVNIGPLRGRRWPASWPTTSPRCSACATAAAGCAGASTLRSTARWAAAAHRASATSTPTPTAARSTVRWRCSTRPDAARGPAARRDRPADARRLRASAATSAPPRSCAGASGSRCCSTASAACCARCTPTRGWCWPGTRRRNATTRSGSSRGRVADWGPLPGPARARRAHRTRCWSRRGGKRHGAVPAEEVDEVRIAAAWIAEHEPPQLSLAQAPSAPRLKRFLEAAAA